MEGSESLRLNPSTGICSCKYWLKYKVFGHLLALKSLLDSNEFVNRAKRGGQKKAAKALVKDPN